MQTKLTLRMDAELIRQAKEYAARDGRSVSELVAGYFARLADGVRPAAAASAPRRSSFYGIAKPPPGVPMPGIEDWRAHLERKYLGEELGKEQDEHGADAP